MKLLQKHIAEMALKPTQNSASPTNSTTAYVVRIAGESRWRRLWYWSHIDEYFIRIDRDLAKVPLGCLPELPTERDT